MDSWLIHNGTDIPYAPNKDPDSQIPYGVAWDAFLPDGDTISSSTWIIPAGLTNAGDLMNQTAVINGRSYSKCNLIVLSGGTDGQEYEVTNRIVSSPSGWKEDRSFKVRVKEK